MQFYAGDWLREPNLRLCDDMLKAKGLWIDMLCLMFFSEKRGCLVANGKQVGSKDLAKLVGLPEPEIAIVLDDLDKHNVFSRLPDGTIYSRRMRRDVELQRKRVEAGRLGGKAKAKGRQGKQDESFATEEELANGKQIDEEEEEVEEEVEHEHEVKPIKKDMLFSCESDELRLSELLFAQILAIKPDYKKPDLQAWARDVDRMVRIDNRKPDKIEAVIKWLNTDDFWYKVILSPAKLRKQFDQLEIKMKGAQNGRTGKGGQGFGRAGYDSTRDPDQIGKFDKM